MDTVKIIGGTGGSVPSKNSWKVKSGAITESLLNNQIHIDDEGKKIIKSEAIDLLSKCSEPKEYDHYDTGIAIGYVQSGKTMSFTTVLALAADNNYSIAIILAGTTIPLLNQTSERLINDLEIQGVNRKRIKLPQKVEKSVIRRWLRLPDKPLIIIPILKHHGHIKKLVDLFKSSEISSVLKNKPCIIIDDEADQASLNTFARKNDKKQEWEDDEFSATYLSISALRDQLKNHTYLQYTATPQGPLLISLTDLLSPSFHKILTPGEGYTGGKDFFISNPKHVIRIPDREVYHRKDNPLSECPESLREALQIFIVGSIIHEEIRNHDDVYSMMIHPDLENNDCELFYGWVKNMIDSWGDTLDDELKDPEKDILLEEFETNYDKFKNTVTNAPQFIDIKKYLFEKCLDIGVWLVIGQQSGNPNRTNKVNWSQYSSHILIGANMLNRGFTVEGLAVTYMPRYSKGKTIADTMQQRARFFGYKKKYFDLTRVYLPEDSILEYENYVRDEEELRKVLSEKSIEEFSRLMLHTDLMNPTRNNILSDNIVKYKMSGARQIHGLSLSNIADNNQLFEKFTKNIEFTLFKDFETEDRNHGIASVSIKDCLDFLRLYKVSHPSEVTRKMATMQYLRYWEEKGIEMCHVFKMAYRREKGNERVRKTIKKDNYISVQNIFAGRSTSGSETYPGDQCIFVNNSLNLQLHTIRIKRGDQKSPFDDKIISALGLIYPSELAQTYIKMNKRNSK